jgi:uncharacterized membrane protein
VLCHNSHTFPHFPFCFFVTLIAHLQPLSNSTFALWPFASQAPLAVFPYPIIRAVLGGLILAVAMVAVCGFGFVLAITIVIGTDLRYGGRFQICTRMRKRRYIQGTSHSTPFLIHRLRAFSTLCERSTRAQQHSRAGRNVDLLTIHEHLRDLIERFRM